MSKNLPNMLDGTLEKLRQMVDGNSIIGDAIHVGEDITVIPISKISLGVAGGGADYVSKHPNNQENPFGGGVGAGVKVTPVAFLVMKEGNVRVIPMAVPASTTADRLVEMVPDTLDKIVSFIDSKTAKKSE